MKNAFKKENRVLLAELVRTDFKLRYQGSVLGYSWSLLRPLLMFLILYVVFARFLRVGDAVPNFPIYLLFGIVLWTFFADMTSQSLASIVGRGDLIRKIRIPRWLIVVSTSVSAIINLFLNLAVVLVFILITKMDILATSIWIPLILLQIYILGLGLSLILATSFVKYRDVSYIWEVILQAGFYVTPILYPVSYVLDHASPTIAKIMLLNPMAQAINDARYMLVTHDTLTLKSLWGDWTIYFVPLGFSVFVLIVGVLYFRKEAKNFAEDL